MQCPKCGNDAGDRRITLFFRNRVDCEECHEAHFAEPVRASLSRALAAFLILFAGVIAVSQFRLLESESLFTIKMKVASGLATMFSLSWYFRPYKLTSCAQLGNRMMRRYTFSTYAHHILIAMFVAANLLGAIWLIVAFLALIVLAFVDIRARQSELREG